jgi:hypothetical protein
MRLLGLGTRSVAGGTEKMFNEQTEMLILLFLTLSILALMQL